MSQKAQEGAHETSFWAMHKPRKQMRGRGLFNYLSILLNNSNFLKSHDILHSLFIILATNSHFENINSNVIIDLLK